MEPDDMQPATITTRKKEDPDDPTAGMVPLDFKKWPDGLFAMIVREDNDDAETVH